MANDRKRAPGLFLREHIKVVVGRDGPNVILRFGDREAHEIPWEHALQVAKALRIKASEAEEEAKHEQITLDQALLMRSGAPFGLTNHPQIIADAKKEAAHNRELRKAIPSIKSREIFGRPRVIMHPPKEGKRDDKET